MLKKVILAFFLSLAIFPWTNKVLAQDNTIYGRVIDAETKEPLVYASVRIQDDSEGLVSNLIGEFIFHIPDSKIDQNIVISMLGYSNFIAPASELVGPSDQVRIIELQRVDVLLDEVVIVDSLTGGEIFQIALERIEMNYPMEPYSMNGFYRDIKKVDGKYRSLLEAAINIYDKNYEAPKNPRRLRERVELIEVRKSLSYGDYSDLFDNFNLLEEFFFDNNIKYRTFETLPEFLANMRRGEITTLNDRTVYEVYLIGDNNFVLMMYIDIEDYSIYWMKFEYGSEETPINIFERKNAIEEFTRKEKFIEFSVIDGRLYPRFMRSTTKSTWRDPETNEIVNKTELVQELLVNEVKTEDPEWIPSSRKMRGYGLQYQDMPYNEKFWENYNILKNSPLDEEVLADLEELGKLEEQFKNN